MRKHIDIVNEAQGLLVEGVKETIESIIDKVMSKISTKHISYATACAANKRIVELTGDDRYTDEELALGSKVAKDACQITVSYAIVLAYMHSINIPLTAAIISTTIALITAINVHLVKSKRDVMVSRKDRLQKK